MRLPLILPVAAVTALAVGCGSDDENTEPARTQAAPPAAEAAGGAPDELLGTYTRRVTKADIDRTEKHRSELGPGQQRPRPSNARLVIEGDRITFRGVEDAGGPPFEVEQDITATGRKLDIGGYLHPEVGAFCGPEIPQNASYTWTLRGTTLRLKAARDRCADRDSMLTGEWRRKG